MPSINYMICKITLNMSITLIILCLFSLLNIPKESAEFYIVIVSLIISVAVLILDCVYLYRFKISNQKKRSE